MVINVNVPTVTNNLALLIDGAIRGEIDRGWWLSLLLDLLLVGVLLVCLYFREGGVTKGL